VSLPIAMIADDVEARVLRTIAKHSCRELLCIYAERVQYFARRIGELGETPTDLAIVIIDTKDDAGAALAEILTSDVDWLALKNSDAPPIVRGLVGRPGLQALLEEMDPAEAVKFAAIAGPAVLVVHQGVVAFFEAHEAWS